MGRPKSGNRGKAVTLYLNGVRLQTLLRLHSQPCGRHSVAH